MQRIVSIAKLPPGLEASREERHVLEVMECDLDCKVSMPLSEVERGQQRIHRFRLVRLASESSGLVTMAV